jgi:hypothetical protein
MVEFASSTGNPEDVVIYFEPPDNNNNFIFYLNGADDILFKNLSFYSVGTLYSRIFLITGTVTNLSFENCLLRGSYKGDNDNRHSLILFSNSFVRNFLVKNCDFSEGSHGIESSSASYQNVHIENNRFTRIGYEAISMRNSEHVFVSKNVIDGAAHAIDFNNSSGQDTLLYNLVTDCYAGVLYHQGQSENSRTALIMNNIFVSTRYAGGHGVVEIQSGKDIKIYHNTIINKSNYTGSRSIYIRGNNLTSGISIVNNLIINFYRGYTIFMDQANAVTECDYNVLYTAGPYFAYWTENCFSLEGLQSLSGMNQHSMIGVPFLPVNTDFVPVSPYVDNKGIPLEPTIPDFYGNSRDGQTPDVGAVEFTSSGDNPLHGYYTIGSGGQFSTLTDALKSALLKGIDGPVTFAYLDGEYSVRDTLFPVPGSSTNNTILVTSNSQDSMSVILQTISTDYSTTAFFTLGSSFYTVSHLSFRMEGARDYALRADAYIKEFHFTHNNVQHNPPTTIGAIDNGISLNTAYYEYFSITNNYFAGCGRTIIANHSGNALRPKKLEIRYNEFYPYYSPYYSSDIDDIIFENNFCTGSSLGPSFTRIFHRFIFRNNVIGTSSREALQISNSTLHPVDTSLVVNNFLSKMTSSVNSYEVVDIYKTENLWFTNNNVKGYTIASGSGILRIFDVNHLHLLNNIFVNDTTGYVVYTTGTNYIDDMDYNNYTTSGLILAIWNSTVCENLDTLRNVNGMDTHSLSVPVQFAGSYDLHINEPALDNKGLPLPFVKKDIDGDYRHPLYPDIGADEFTPFPLNPPNLVSPIPDQTINEDENNVTIIHDLNIYFSDPDTGDALSFRAASDNPNLTVSVRPVPVSNISLSVTPEPNYFGNANIIVTATDLTNLSVRDTFVLTVLPVPDQPIAMNDEYEVNYVDSTILYPMENDSSIDKLPLTITAIGTPAVGSASISPDHSSIIYYPASSPWTDDSLFYVIQQSDNLLTDTAWIFIHFKQIFTEIQAGIPGYRSGGMEFLDVDQDGYLDLFIGGNRSSSTNDYEFYIYRNIQGTSFTPQWYIPGLTDKRIHSQADIVVRDFNHDNAPDLVLSVMDTSDLSFNIVFLESIGTLYNMRSINIPGYHYGNILMFDINNDGEQEFLATGSRYHGEYKYHADLYQFFGTTMSIPPIYLYHNIDSTLLRSYYSGSVAADFDKDGDMDLFMTGMVSEYLDKDSAQFYMNENGNFVPVYTPPISIVVVPGNVCIGDFDGNGMPDILYSGKDRKDTSVSDVGGILFNRINPVTHEWQFENYTGPFEGGDYTVCADFDNDGDEDIIMFPGWDFNNWRPGHFYENDGMGNFTLTPYQLPKMRLMSGAVGDIDNDNKVDLILMGASEDGLRTVVLKNQTENPNLPPDKPTIAGGNITDSTITISWLPASDDHTPQNLLNYNLSVSDEISESNIFSSCSRTNGMRFLSDRGNIGEQTSWSITHLVSGKLYYFGVQAIDGARSASPFSDIMGIPTFNSQFMEVLKLPLLVGPGSAAADFNHDGIMDVLGEDLSFNSLILFQTQPGPQYPTFVKITKNLPQNLSNVQICPADVNGDGFMDAFIHGYNATLGGYTTNLYLYDPVELHFQQDPNFYSVAGRSMASCDIDNDGDIDLIYKSAHYPSNLGLILNQKDHFESVFIDFVPYTATFDIGDIDNDGDVDIVAGIRSLTDTCVLGIAFNQGESFIVDTTSLRCPEYGTFKLMDFDNDGDLDLIVSGYQSTSNQNEPWHRTCYLYENLGGRFTIKDHLEEAGLDDASIAAGDFDNDGAIDFVIRGFKRGDSQASYTSLFINDGSGRFTRYTDSYLPDYILNGTALALKTLTPNLDFVISGINKNHNDYSSLIFNTHSTPPNENPTVPSNLHAEVTPDSIIFTWDPSTDNETPAPALTYNLRIGTGSGLNDIKPSYTLGDKLLIADDGNVGHVTRWVLKNPPTTGSIYWSVQAVDNSYRTSAFAPEQVIVLTDITDNNGELPKKFALHQNYPNPFNPSTEIKFDVPRAGHVTLQIYNALGQLVTTLVDREMKPGYHKVTWDARKYPSGIYFYRMKADHFIDHKKMVLIK